MQAAAGLGAGCIFIDRKGLARSWPLTYPDVPLPPCGERAQLDSYQPIIACDNVAGAADIHGFRAAPGPRPALVVGNERLGISHGVLSRAQHTVQIPMAGRGIGSLNVAVAAAIALYYLGRGAGPIAE
jgi:SpoU rRNA Methylase family